MYQGVVGGPSRGSRASSQAGFGVRQPQYEEEEIIPEEQEIQVLHLYSKSSPVLSHQCCHSTSLCEVAYVNWFGSNRAEYLPSSAELQRQMRVEQLVLLACCIYILLYARKSGGGAAKQIYFTKCTASYPSLVF